MEVIQEPLTLKEGENKYINIHTYIYKFNFGIQIKEKVYDSWTILYI